MELVDPEQIRLRPGQGKQAMFARGPEDRGQVGFFIRLASGRFPSSQQVDVEQRAGLIRFNDVLLVLTMFRLQSGDGELFDIWWNYYGSSGSEDFDHMSRQDTLILHLYDQDGRGVSLEAKNTFQKFFHSLPNLIRKTTPWSDIEFDRAVRGFCAQAYPKENLWEMIQLQPEPEELLARTGTADDYPGFIPEELHEFYVYLPDQGHCIKVIPSAHEEMAMKGNPEEFLAPAPVKTVMRGGVRWVKGYPIAPIPFIPGLGLAVPPDDKEV